MIDRWYTLKVNPEPWAIGTVAHNRISPNPGLVAYQSAVREELEGEPLLPESMRTLTFYFFRRIDQYLDTADHVRTRNSADATNMQKALEDALQGILFKNDREIRDIRSVIVQQGQHVDSGFTIIRAQETIEPRSPGRSEIPADMLEQALRRDQTHKTSRWQDSENFF